MKKTVKNVQIPFRSNLPATVGNRINEFWSLRLNFADCTISYVLQVVSIRNHSSSYLTWRVAVCAFGAQKFKSKDSFALAAKNVPISFLFIFSYFLIKFVQNPICVA